MRGRLLVLLVVAVETEHVSSRIESVLTGFNWMLYCFHDIVAEAMVLGGLGRRVLWLLVASRTQCERRRAWLLVLLLLLRLLSRRLLRK